MKEFFKSVRKHIGKMDVVYEYMALGIDGLHFYSLNKADAALEICEACGLSYRK